jgi:hypothetical protein
MAPCPTKVICPTCWANEGELADIHSKMVGQAARKSAGAPTKTIHPTESSNVLGIVKVYLLANCVSV